MFAACLCAACLYGLTCTLCSFPSRSSLIHPPFPLFLSLSLSLLSVLFQAFDTFPPVVLKQNCFDDLLIPADHVSRSPSDTYYVDDLHCLRTHTSAHQSTLIKSGEDEFLVSGDVYRRDEIDSTHYPVFHQMEGVKMFPIGTASDVILADLKTSLEGMTQKLFGDCEMRWNDDYFPFTDPSLELEIFYQGEWLEVRGLVSF